MWESGTVVEREDDGPWWWTWARAAETRRWRPHWTGVVDVDDSRPENHSLRLRTEVEPAELSVVLEVVASKELPRPVVTEDAVGELKFGEILHDAELHLAFESLAVRGRSRGVVTATPPPAGHAR